MQKMIKNTIGSIFLDFAKPSEALLFSEKNKVIPKSHELVCKNYGFDCNYSILDSDINKVIIDFQRHTLENHYIEYPEGVLMRFIMNKGIQVSDI